MNKDLEGPIVNVGMRAVAIHNHICVCNVSKTDKTIRVYREKLFTLSEKNSPFASEAFSIRYRNTEDIKEMLHFIKYHFEIAINSHILSKDEINTHKVAIDILENEIKERIDLEKVTYKYLINNLIKEKEYEIDQLKSKLTKLEED